MFFTMLKSYHDESLYFLIYEKDLPASGVARSLFFGGGSASVASIYGGPPLRCSENEGNALFSYILHHKHDYIEHEIGRMFFQFG